MHTKNGEMVLTGVHFMAFASFKHQINHMHLIINELNNSKVALKN